MRKKNLLVFVLLAITTFTCFAKRDVYFITGNDKHTRSIEVINPIKAWIEDDNQSLQLECSANLGALKVSVTNENGEIIYNQEVYATTGSTFQISLNRPVEIGDTLVITYNDNIMYGDL